MILRQLQTTLARLASAWARRMGSSLPASRNMSMPSPGIWALALTALALCSCLFYGYDLARDGGEPRPLWPPGDHADRRCCAWPTSFIPSAAPGGRSYTAKRRSRRWLYLDGGVARPRIQRSARPACWRRWLWACSPISAFAAGSFCSPCRRPPWKAPLNPHPVLGDDARRDRLQPSLRLRLRHGGTPRARLPGCCS